jgi:hypothetical protein
MIPIRRSGSNPRRENNAYNQEAGTGLKSLLG